MSDITETRFQFEQFPTLHSDRLLFTPIDDTDAVDIFDIRINKQVIEYIDREPTKNIAAIKDFIQYVANGFAEQQFIFWGIRLASNRKLIGTICLWHFTDDKYEAEIGYELHPSYWANGYADESVKRIIQFSSQALQLKKLEAFTHRENKASCHLLLKNKFVMNPKRVDQGNLNNAIYELYLPRI